MKFSVLLIRVTYQPLRLLGAFSIFLSTDKFPMLFSSKSTSWGITLYHSILKSLKSRYSLALLEKRPL
jgi:hypothetical protein